MQYVWKECLILVLHKTRLKFKQGHDVPSQEYLECCIIVFGLLYISVLGLGTCSSTGTVYSKEKPDWILDLSSSQPIRKQSAAFKGDERR